MTKKSLQKRVKFDGLYIFFVTSNSFPFLNNYKPWIIYFVRIAQTRILKSFSQFKTLRTIKYQKRKK